MKVLLVSHSSQLGGAQKVLVMLAKALVESHHEVFCAPPSDHGYLPDRMREAGVMTTATDSADVVISNTATTDKGIRFASTRGIPHVWYVHEFRQDSTVLPSGHVVAISETIKRDLGDSATVIHTGIPVADGEPNPSPVIVTAGGICRRKGQLTLLRAAAEVLKEFPEAEFSSVGGPWERDYFDQIRSERKILGIPKEKFPFHRGTRDMEAFYRTGGIFASSPEREPFGLCIIEAMAHGLPVVTTRSGGPEEIVIEGETGFLVPLGDHKAMADRIVYLLRNPEETIRMGTAGRDRVKQSFNPEEYSARWNDFLGTVV